MEFALRRTTTHTPINGQSVSNGFTNFKLPGANSPKRPLTPRGHEENLPGGWIVQKFGGTSVGKFPINIARDIVRYPFECLHPTWPRWLNTLRAGLNSNRITVVCSARSSSTKSEGTTNRLLRAAAEAANPTSRAYIEIVDAIKKDHIKHAEETIKSRVLIERFTAEVNSECENLVRVLESAQYLEQVEWRAQDRIISKGEKLACRFMTALLQDLGVDAAYVDVSDVLRPLPAPGNTRLDEPFYTAAAVALGHRINECEAQVPVVTGFFGNVPGGLLDAIGRGYTDLCAALIAVGLKAKELQVWKEVDGIFTADPRKVPTARLLSAVTPSEAAELTFYGSEVIHPFTMEQVIRARIPIRIKNVMNPKNPGTVIFPDPADDLAARPQTPLQDSKLFLTRNPSHFRPIGQRPKRPTAITVKHDIVILNVHSNKRAGSHGFMRNIFATLDKWHLTVDLVASSEVHVSMALHSEAGMLGGGSDEMEVEICDTDLLGAVSELQEYGTVNLVNNRAIVSLVGKQLKNMVGISGRLFSTLGANNINIDMISQGASEINISCVIEDRDADRALNVLHTNLFTFLEE